MKFLANENVPLKSVNYLLSKGFDIKAISIFSPGITDREVMEIAIAEQRTIITFDRDYGELIFKNDYRPGAGVILLRLDEFQPETAGQLVEMLFSNNEFNPEGALSVIDSHGIRQRKY